MTSANVTHLASLVEYVLRRGLTFHLNFSRAIQDVVRLQDPQEQTRWLTGLREAAHTAVAMSPDRRIIDNLLDLTALGTPHAYPCGAGRHYLVFDPAGNVSACQMDLTHPVTDSTAEDPLSKLRESKNSLPNPAVDEKTGCRACPWRYVCAGGCPLVTQAVYGTSSHASPYCFVYRTLLPELITLEGLRLLGPIG